MHENNNQNDLILYGVQLCLLVVVCRIQEVFPFLIPLHLGKGSMLIVLLLYFVTPNPHPHVFLWQLPQVKIVLFIYMLCLLSIPFSVYRSQSFEHAVYQFSMTLLLLCMLVYVVTEANSLRKILWTFMSGVTLLAFFTVTSNRPGRLSASGTYDPNDIAMLFVITIPLIYFFIANQKGMKKKVLIGMLIIILAAFISTVSRGGFLGLITIAVLIAIKDKGRSWLVKLFVLGSFVFIFLQLAPESYWMRIQTIFSYEQDYNVTAEHGRMTLWSKGINLMLENPITGVGSGAIVVGIGQTFDGGIGKWLTVHNAFVQIGAELGLGGLFLFILLIATCFYQLRKLRIKYSHTSGVCHDYLWLISALEISLYGYCVTAMFISSAYFAMFYFLVALCCIIQKLDLLSLNLIDEKK
jgi:O-antigen ligase